MKLTLRRPPLLVSFLGFIEIKTGAKMVILFAILNKVAGVYGLIAVLTGAGGGLAQLSMYLYSVLGLAAFAWGFKGVSEEDTRKALITAHFFIADHFLNTLWLVFFGVDCWLYNPHDGARALNSVAQQEIADVGPGHGEPMTDAERFAAAQGIWNREKGSTAAVLAVGWLLKFYFAALLYSYAAHLRKGTYRSLPLTLAASHRTDDYTPLYENELDEQYVNEVDGNYDPRRPGRSSRDIDFDAEFEGLDGTDDLERGRVRGRVPGASLSVGGYGEMVGATRASRTGQPKAPNGTPPSAQRQQRVSYKPVAMSSANPLSKTQSSQHSPDKGKSRAIQQELERNGGVEKWDDEDEDDNGVKPTSRARTPVQGLSLSGDGQPTARSPHRRDASGSITEP